MTWRGGPGGDPTEEMRQASLPLSFLVLGTELPSGPKGPPEFALQQLEVGVLCVGEEGGKHGLRSLQNLHSIPTSTTNWP